MGFGTETKYYATCDWCGEKKEYESLTRNQDLAGWLLEGLHRRGLSNSNPYPTVVLCPTCDDIYRLCYDKTDRGKMFRAAVSNFQAAWDMLQKGPQATVAHETSGPGTDDEDSFS